jgi:protoporphyrinogen oxidase
MMWEAAAAKTKAQGGTILMDRCLQSLSFDQATNLWTVTVRSGDGDLETHLSRHVISSAAITELTAAIEPRPQAYDHAMALRYRDFITVSLIAKIPDGASDAGFPDNWVYIHDPAVKVGRVQNFLSWSPEMAPRGFACLGLEYFCFEGDGLWSASDEDLVALAKREIGHIGLISSARVVDAEVVRQSKAYPIYDDAYQTHVDAVRDEFQTAYPSLHLVGRNGMHKYNNQDHAMMTAMLTVANILAGAPLFDVWQVNEDAEYGEAGASGVQEALKSERLVPRRAA